MLIHPWDAALDDEEWRALLRRHDFGTLVASGRGRDVPVVVPTHFVFDGDRSVVLHLARPNPLWAAVGENPSVLLSVTADWTYVPASWKAVGEEDPALGIPTTYYASVQLVGRAEVLVGNALLDVLRTQLDHFEPGSGVADPQVHARRLPGIRGLRLEATEVRAKLKYGGNVDADHRAAVADHLAQRGAPGDLAARGHLLRRSGRMGA